MFEITIQILLLVLAFYLINTSYQKNKQAEAFSLKKYLNTVLSTKEKFTESTNQSFMAYWFIIGLTTIIIVLVYKILTCGLVCY